MSCSSRVRSSRGSLTRRGAVSAIVATTLTAAAAAMLAPHAGEPFAEASAETIGSMSETDTIILFDGGTWDAWKARDSEASPWEVLSDGSVESRGGDAISRRQFSDVQVHVEFLCPIIEGARGQHRANSGIYLHGRYELQILDSSGDRPSADGCGAIYGLAQPLVNAGRPAGNWQSFDIIFRAPRLNISGTTVTEPARITAIQNGIVIHNNVVLPTPTPGGIDRELQSVGPIVLQDRGEKVRFRNIWARPL